MAIFLPGNMELLRKARKLSQEKMANALDLKRSTYANYEAGETEPDFETLQKIVRFFGITVDELLFSDLVGVHPTDTGKELEKAHPIVHANAHPKGKKGVIYQEIEVEEGVAMAPIRPTNFMPRVITVDNQGNENAVLVPVRARAGYLSGYSDPNFIEKLPAYRLPGMSTGTYRIFEVEGTSMFPTLQGADKVITRWTAVSELRDDRVHVLITQNDGILIKRVLNRLAEGKLVLKSDNNHKGEYPNIVLDIHEVLEAWYVVERWTRSLPSPGEIYKRIVDLEADMALIKQKLIRG